MWQETPFVFLGTVELADPDLPGDQTIFQAQLVRIRVDEAFKGVTKGQVIELNQGGSDCDAKFRTGQRAVFYMDRGHARGTFFVPWCTRALGSAEAGSDDLLFLRGLPKSAVGTRLSGAVRLDEKWSHEIHSTAVPNVKVRISGPDGLRRETVTNSAGAYEVYGLRPGRYSVKINAPAGLKQWFSSVSGGKSAAGDDSSFQLTANMGASVDLGLEADTRVSARVLAADGFPPSLTLCFQMEPLQAPGETVGFECPKADGRFTFTELPPGQYRLLTHDTVETKSFTSKSILYYPGVRDRGHAGIVTVEAGKHIDGLEILIPASEARTRLTGKVFYADGTPVTGVSVTFTSPELGYSESTSADKDGSFNLYVLAGMKGQLSAEMSIIQPLLLQCPQFVVQPRWKGMFRYMDSNTISVSTGSDQDNLQLTMPSPPCAAWPPQTK